MAIGPRAARVRRRPELPQEPQLVERGLELAATGLPVDLRQRTERRLDSRPLPLAGEVRAEPGAEVARAPDVQRLAVRVAEHVGARRRRCLRDERALGVEAAGPRRRQLDEVGHRLGPALLREADQGDQDLGGRLCIGERPVTGLDRRPEEVREVREAEPLRPAAQQPPGEPDRVDHRSCDPPARQPLDGAVEEAHVEARVVGDEDGVAGEREEAPHGEVGGRCAAHVALGDTRQGGDRRRQRHARVDERLERGAGLERLHPLGADLDDPRAGRRETGRLEVEHDERGVLEQDGGTGWVGEPDRGAAPREPRVTRDDIVEQRAGDRRRGRREREERAGRVAGRHRPPSRLDELDEAVGAVEGELHPSMLYEHMFVCQGATKERAPHGPSLVFHGGGRAAS